MRISVLIIAALSGLWTVFLTLAAYMTTTGLIDPRVVLGAAVPLVISLTLTVRFVLNGGGWGTATVAICIAVVPFAFLGFVAIQQLFFPYGLPVQQ